MLNTNPFVTAIPDEHIWFNRLEQDLTVLAVCVQTPFLFYN